MTQTRIPHLLNVMSGRLLLRLVTRNGFDPRHAGRMAAFAGASAVTLPLRLIDRCRSVRRVRRARIDPPPVFVIGHWRSGTTHLQNLLLCDPRFGTLTAFHCIAAQSFLGLPGLIRSLARRRVSGVRPMDAMPVSLDAPQEEEFALARMTPLSFNHSFTFPRKARELFDLCVTFESGHPRVSSDWKRAYDLLLRRLAVDQPGKTLCLKNPPNTARIRLLLELYPQARFVHIYRNPYVVYRSTMHLWERLLPVWSVQSADRAEIERNVLDFYARLLKRYFAESRAIPRGQLSEVRFEDLEADPVGELERVYEELSLGDFGRARPHLQRYVESLSDYHKNRYSFQRETLERVEREWGFALRRWGYDRPVTESRRAVSGRAH